MSQTQKIQVILVDDELAALFIMNKILKEFEEVEIIGEARNATDAISMIDEKKPDLVFLDISMPYGSGFDVLEQVKFKDFEVAFVSSHRDYALKAFEYSALHYIPKPIRKEDFRIVMERFQKIRSKSYPDACLPDSQTHERIHKIVLPTKNELLVVNVKTIIRCESSSNYTIIHFIDKPKVIVTKSLSYFEELLINRGFIRIHNSHLVNMLNISEIKDYGKKMSSVIMINGNELLISARKKYEVLEAYKKFNTGQ